MATKTRKASVQKVRITRATRQKRLTDFVALCFGWIETGDLKELANKTHLSVGTLYKLRNGGATLKCQYNTVEALATVAGFKTDYVREEFQTVLVD